MPCLTAIAEQSEQRQKQVDKIKIQFQSTGNGLAGKRVTGIGAEVHTADFLRVISSQTGEDDNGQNRQSKA